MASMTLETGGDGALDGTDVPTLDAFFAAETDRAEPLLVYFHGGLVNHADGMAAAATVAAAWSEASTLSVVWRTGPFEVILNNLKEAIHEPLFRDLTIKVLGWAVGRLADVAGNKAGPTLGPAPESQLFVNGDYRDFSVLEQASTGAPPLTPVEQAAFEAAVLTDPRLQSDLLAIGLAAGVDASKEHAKAIGGGPPPRTSLIDQDVVERLRTPAGADLAKGLLPGWSWFAKRAVDILVRVVKRVVTGRHHGTYPTVIEEIAREFYLAAAGHFLWKTIKKEAADTFVQPERGGSLLTARLHALRIARPAKLVVLVGHSAGSIYVCGVLDRLAALNPQVTVDVALMAPTVTTARFATSLAGGAASLGRFRMFAMDDDHERADRCLGIAYPRSLLYLVSGCAEDEVDAPLLGMQRHLRGPFTDPGTSAARAFLGPDPIDRCVWSVQDRGPGLAATAAAHGDFDNDPATLASVSHFAGM